MFPTLNIKLISTLALIDRFTGTAFAAGTTRRLDTHTLRDIGHYGLAADFAD